MMPQWAGKLGSFVGGLILAGIDAWQKRNDPPMRIDELHVGATTEAAVEQEREAARAKWPDADTTRLPRPPRVPREGNGGPS
jgi:hypothetical protein